MHQSHTHDLYSHEESEVNNSQGKLHLASVHTKKYDLSDKTENYTFLLCITVCMYIICIRAWPEYPRYIVSEPDSPSH